MQKMQKCKSALAGGMAGGSENLASMLRERAERVAESGICDKCARRYVNMPYVRYRRYKWYETVVSYLAGLSLA